MEMLFYIALQVRGICQNLYCLHFFQGLKCTNVFSKLLYLSQKHKTEVLQNVIEH